MGFLRPSEIQWDKLSPELSVSNVEIMGRLPLFGEVDVGGDKIAALHLSLAALVSDSRSTFKNISICGDLVSVLSWMESAQAARINASSVQIEIAPLGEFEINLLPIAQIRSSICLVSALALKFGRVIFSPPGGCNFTHRPIRRHLDLIRSFGIEIRQLDSTLEAIAARAPSEIVFDCSTEFGPSVGVTCHAIIAAQVFEGEITLHNIALEPAVCAVAKYVRKATGRSVLLDERRLTVGPKFSTKKDGNVDVRLPTDFTEVMTYVASGMAAGGEIAINGLDDLPKYVIPLLDKLQIHHSNVAGSLYTRFDTVIHPGYLECRPWPGLPSDIGPLVVAGLARHPGATRLVDLVYDKRSSHLEGLARMGYRVAALNRAFTVEGATPSVDSIVLRAGDIRAGAALIVGALARDGRTTLTNYSQVARGYASLIRDLNRLGASLKSEVPL